MRDFDSQKKFREMIERIDKGIKEDNVLIPDMTGPAVTPQKQSILPLYNVFTTFGGSSKPVAFSVPLNEAEIIKRHVERKMQRLASLEEIGKIDFEITIVEIKRT